MSKVYTIASQKGGVGKTTSVLNIASALTLKGKKVLIIDMDPQGGTIFGLGIKKQTITGGVFNIFKEKSDPEEMVHLTSYNNLDVLPFGSFDNVEHDAVYKAAKEDNNDFIAKIRKLSNNYDFVVIDCPPGSGPLTRTALEIANSLIIPLQCEPLALKTLPQLLKLIKITKAVNPELKLEGILLTQYERSSPVSKEILQQVVSNFPSKSVIEVIIPYDESFSTSYKTGKPLVLYDSPIPGASAYKLLADEIISGEISRN